MEDILFLKSPLHLNKTKGFFEKLTDDRKEKIFEVLTLSFEGSIIGVKRSSVEHFFSEPDIKKIRHSMKIPKEFLLPDEEHFFKMLALLIPLEEAI